MPRSAEPPDMMNTTVIKPMKDKLKSTRRKKLQNLSCLNWYKDNQPYCAKPHFLGLKRVD